MMRPRVTPKEVGILGDLWAEFDRRVEEGTMTDDDEATCKRFYKENNYYRLQPENSSMDPIILDSVLILGKVVGLYRNHII